MTESERQEVLAKLGMYRDQLQGLMDLIADKTHLGPEAKARAHEQMKALKEGLDADHKFGSSVKGRSEMNECERAYFYPAVHQASTQFQSRWNSDPIRSNWHSELYAAQVDINHLLRQLERQTAEA